MPMGQMQKTIKLNVKVAEKLWPYQVVDEIQKVMEGGLKKYPDGEGWEKSYMFHVDRAMEHLKGIDIAISNIQWDVVNINITHAFTRLMMAVAIINGYAPEGISPEDTE